MGGAGGPKSPPAFKSGAEFTSAPRTMAWFFLFFLVSGFCSLVYQVVWLRLAMAGFGVTAPMVSIVLSTFMAGLALGSWGAGRLARRASSPALPLRLYALAELGIAVGGVVVPAGLALGRSWLAGAADVAWGSAAHYLAAGACVALVLLPFCACMGATFPLAMWAIRRRQGARSAGSFSYLYLANVLGAALGTLASAFVLIELLGFRRTALLAAGLNALLAAAAWGLSLSGGERPPEPAEAAAGDGAHAAAGSPRLVPWLLFTTGLASMGMEVVWVRQFTPYLGTVVYAFAAIVALYLAATFAGSWAYRRWQRADPQRRPAAGWWPALALIALLPLLAADPRLPFPDHILAGAVRVALGIAPLCALLGFLTPLLLDRWSRGDAERAGSAYALNVIGCILGPLLAGFVLLPGLGERGTLLALSLPLFAAGAFAAPLADGRRARAGWAAAVAGSLLLLAGTRDFATLFQRRIVVRDHAATVIAAGEGQSRRLLVNGVGMTVLTPITKLMAHLPLAFLDAPPQRGLVVCFGMGTSFRSLLSWDIESTAVELVPSVPQLFAFFHPDGPRKARVRRARIVIDDGRRFLERTREEFDVITIDPPPPVEAAGSSLLYSREFYELAARRLRPGGVLQQWVPAGDNLVYASFTRAIGQSFRHVRAFRSLEGYGVHYLASDRRLPPLTAAELAARLPPAASADLTEWGPAPTAAAQFAIVLKQEVAVSEFLQLAPGAPALTDDHPVNEYYWLRRFRAR
jgi:spermidine synthase